MFVYIPADQSCANLPSFEFIFAVESAHLLPLLLAEDGQVDGGVEDVIRLMFCRSSHINDLVVAIEISNQVSCRHHRDHRGITLFIGGSPIPEVSMRVKTDFSS